jgi:hypothetical protein
MLADQQSPCRVVAVDARADNLAYIRHSLAANNISDRLPVLIHNSVRCKGDHEC